MKKPGLLIMLLFFAVQVGHAQTKQRSRSPFLHTAAAHPSHEDRGSAPANDDCANAQVVAVTTDCSAPVTGDNSQATDDGPDVSCDDAGAELLDVWYTFNSGLQDTVAITLIPSAGMGDWDFVVYDGCGGAEVSCNITPSGTVNVPVALNTDYWVRIYSNTSYGVGAPFSLCVSEPLPTAPAPPNDVCSNVVPQPVATGSSVSFTGTTLGASGDEGLGYPLVWEAFTLNTCADVKITYCGTAPAWSGFWLLLYSGCPPAQGVFVSSYDSTACGDGNFTLCFPNLAAGSYYYPVAQAFPVIGPYSLTVSAMACGEEVASNDDCIGAIPIAAHPTCETSFFTNPCATQSLPAVTCGTFTGDATDDVWYSFTATYTDMTVGGAPNGTMDIVMELFSGTCGSLTSIACGDVGGPGVADDMIATGLTVGSTYYFRVYDFGNTYSYTEPGYDLCVVAGQGSGVGVNDTGADRTHGPIYPNPNNGDFTLPVGLGAQYVHVTIMDATGRTVLQRGEPAIGGVLRMSLGAQFVPGIYHVRVDNGRSVQEAPLVIH